MVMAKNYLLLNVSDYRTPASSNQQQRATPVQTLQAAFQRRVAKKGGSFTIFNLSDLFGGLRLEIHSGPLGHHEVQGILEPAVLQRLLMEAPVRRSLDWRQLINAATVADRIVLSAHGHKDDTDNVYCEVGFSSVRCGNVEGIADLFQNLLALSGNANPSVTLSVCYAARSAQHQKQHDQALTEQDIRSSLAFKLFVALSEWKPGIRLTARTGAVSASQIGTSLLSETEQAIVASETKEAEFSGSEADDLVADTMQALDDFERALGQSSLSRDERNGVLRRLDDWRGAGYDPAGLEEILGAANKLDQGRQSAGARLLTCLAKCCAMDLSWQGQQQSVLQGLRQLVRQRHRLQELSTAADEKAAKYGKFVYQRQGGKVVVSRWLPAPDGSGRYLLWKLMSLNA
jgi:hypothetical protein